MIHCLTEVFTEDGLIQIVDGLRVNKPGIFHRGNHADIEMLRMYVDISARLGVELAAMQLPLCGNLKKDAITLEISAEVPEGVGRMDVREGGVSISAQTYGDLRNMVQYFVCCYPYDLNGNTLQQLKERENAQGITEIEVDCRTLQLQRIAWKIGEKEGQKEYQEERCTEAGSIASYQAAEKHFAQNLDVRIVVDRQYGDGETLLVTALRFALENFQTVYPYAVKRAEPGKRNVFINVDGKAVKASVIQRADGIAFTGHPSQIDSLVLSFVKQEENPFENSYLKDVEEILCCKNEVGQVLRAVSELKGSKYREGILVTQEYSRGMVNRNGLESFLQGKLGTGFHLKNFNDERQHIRESYTCSWEGDDFIDAFKEALAGVQPSDRLQIYGVLSEDLDIRKKIVLKIHELAQAAGLKQIEAELYRSFKSGYSWIEEKVIPGVKALQDVVAATVTIRFPYLINELGEEVFEDESTPSYGRHLDRPEKYFDIPTRWLQELFPVDELIAQELNIDRDAVHFLRDDSLPYTYRIEIVDRSDKLIYTDDFEVKYIQKDYIKKYPQIGKVHVTTGWIRVVRNDEIILDRRIKTDPEKIWEILEDHIIPKLEEHLTDKYGRQHLVAAQPLFNRLQLNMQMSEMDYDLGFRQERISTAEAMQEDMYFYLLDWFKTYGERECGCELDNVGLIMPVPVIRKEAESLLEMVVSDDFSHGAELRMEGKEIPLEESIVRLDAREVWFEGEQLHIGLEASEESAVDRAMQLNELLGKGTLDFYAEKPMTLHIHFEGHCGDVLIPQKTQARPTLSDGEKERILKNDVVDYGQYLDLIEYYRQFPEIQAVPSETTYKGQKIFALEFIKRRPGVIYGREKLKNERITCLFTARHHGNEASSLNAAFMLADALRRELANALNQINVVLVPFINIDGGMLHCEVQKQNPKWLCHPARYNSAGFEFRKDFENSNSKYGEARLLGKLWKKWLFDIITDNHGFEGHELCQPFSGYISPWYKSFWVPRALYYGYIWYRSDLEHTVKLGATIREKVADAINRDEEIYGLNRIFAERFYKYAQKWFPDMFTLEQFKEVVFYCIDTALKPREANYGMRNPEITALDWTTETADETAVKEYMYTNARAHHISDLAVIEVMRESQHVIDTGVAIVEHGLAYTRFRRRPLGSKMDGSESE